MKPSHLQTRVAVSSIALFAGSILVLWSKEMPPGMRLFVLALIYLPLFEFITSVAFSDLTGPARLRLIFLRSAIFVAIIFLGTLAAAALHTLLH